VTYVSRPKPLSDLVGLVNGTQLDGMRKFKGSEINVDEIDLLKH
jgi:hypothetical protein